MPGVKVDRSAFQDQEEIEGTEEKAKAKSLNSGNGKDEKMRPPQDNEPEEEAQ